MKKLGKIICYVVAALIVIFSLIFIFLEMRNLISGDFLLYENYVNGFIRYFFRLIIALFALALGIFSYFALSKKENRTFHIYFYFGVVTLLITSIVIACYATTYIDILLLVLSSLFGLGSLLYFIGAYLIKHNQ